MVSELEKDVINDILDKWSEIDNLPESATDLAFDLWQAENIDGTSTYSTYEAEKWVSTNFRELGEYVEEYESEYGQPPMNCFLRPEGFMVQMQIYITSSLLGEFWEDNITKEELEQKLLAALHY